LFQELNFGFGQKLSSPKDFVTFTRHCFVRVEDLPKRVEDDLGAP